MSTTEALKYSILYVDDEEINLRVFKATFEDEFQVFTAINGEVGIQIFKENKIDLIITDQRMPEMSGVEFLKKIIDLNPEPNRILLMGFSDFEALSSAVNEGKIYQYINKPWDESELKPVIYQALEAYYIKKENQMLTKALREKNDLLEREINQKNEVMTQLRHSEQELRTAKEKAEESDRLKTSFLNNMSHEIRTPLNGIVGFAELLCDDDLEVNERRSYYSYIERNSRDLTEIISKVVLLSQLESGMEKLMLEIADGRKIMAEVFNEFAQLYASPQLRFQFHFLLSDDETKLVVDKCKIREIAFQLMENACKFTERGMITLKLARADDKLRISVSDTGIGIPEEHLNVIFERFRKLEGESSKLYRGNGLGLSIVKAYVRLWGGQIAVNSKPGAGSEFVVELPYIQADLGNFYEQGSVPAPEKIHNILIVEDEEDNLDYLKLVFRNTKARLFFARNGEEAVEVCMKNPQIHLVLMDLKMPVMDGFEATRIIKKMSPPSVVIAQSAYAFDEDRKKAMDAGCTDFIVKPLTKNKIGQIISAVN